MKTTRLLFSALALIAVGGGVSACSPALAAGQGAAGQGPAGQGPASAAPVTAGAGGAGAAMTSGVSTGPGGYILQPMPSGQVLIERGARGHLLAQVNVFGLTPGSSHQVSIDGPLGRRVQFPVLIANSVGQADVTLVSVDRVAGLPPLSRLVIRLGDAPGDPVAREPIAESGFLAWTGTGSVLRAVTVDARGVSFGRPAGRATISYDAAAQTLTVTVTASGLNPGSHAAHIHLGSCQNQGAVKYMLADFTADARGDIIDQTRVVTGVTGVPGPGNWYLNLHQGGMSQILANGAPTLAFRPMLCTDITSVAMAAAPAMTSPTTTPTGMPTMDMPTATMTAMPTTATPTATPATPTATPTAIPTIQPTHY